MSDSRPRLRQKVDGVVLLDKPSGISSNAALQRVRRVFNAAKAGHTGTLDPLASGLLPVCLGEATKFSQALLDADKGYEAELSLGVRTDTGDSEGRCIERHVVSCSHSEFEGACARFVGHLDQVPPMYSALKVAGRPLYDYARAGATLERKARAVTIYRIDVLGFDGDVARIFVKCSKGTYIRVLAEEIGAVLGCGAHISALRRTGIGRFDIADSVGLEVLENVPGDAWHHLHPIDHLLGDLPSVMLEDVATTRFLNGQAVRLGDDGPQSTDFRVYGTGGEFLGTGTAGEGSLRPRRLVATGNRAHECG